MRRIATCFFIGSLFLINACGDDDKKQDMGSVDVSFSNGSAGLVGLVAPSATSSGTYTEDGVTRVAYTATTYGMKVVQIYLNEDIAEDGWSNKGNNAYVWINPACDTVTSDTGAITIGNNGNCDTTKISSYFEFARASAAVNADLNSQAIPVPVGTYRYARVQLCDNTIDDKNMRIAAKNGGVANPVALRGNNCVMKPAKIDPPISVGKGQGVTLTLKYDLTKALVDYWYNYSTASYTSTDSVPTYCVRADAGSSGLRCVRDIDFVASVSVKE